MKLSPAWLLHTLQAFPQPKGYLAAFSGGLDSAALLHLLTQIRDKLPGEVRAVHVHHGLASEADAWADHCSRMCGQYSIPLEIVHLHLQPLANQSLEALAREARYSAITRLMRQDELVLTAQHQDDQAETLLLQLLRGSGPAGLASMPRHNKFASGWLARPLLDIQRMELEAYALELKLDWVDDPSNQDQRFDRNFLRHQVIPLLRQRWPSASATIARSARLSGELLEITRETAEQDLAQSLGSNQQVLSVKKVRALSAERRRATLRHWIVSLGASLPGSRHIQQIENACLQERPDAQPLVSWAGHDIRRYRDDLYCLQKAALHDPSIIIPWLGMDDLQLPSNLGKLSLQAADSGIPLTVWQTARIEVRFRQGGELCRPSNTTHHKSLKKLFQEWGIPSWERDRIPIIYMDNELAIIPNRLLCVGFTAVKGERCVKPHWSGFATD